MGRNTPRPCSSCLVSTAAAMPSERLVIGTRGSQLALRQAEIIASALRSLHPRLEIENALLEHRVDLAVHSCKDLPSAIPSGLTLAAFPVRADARDALVSRHGL